MVRRNHRDIEADDDDNYLFEDKQVRLVFVRKVYLTLSVQIAVTTAIIALIIFCEPVQDFIDENGYLRWLAIGTMFSTILVIACCGSVRRSFPCNFILLGIFTLAEGFLVGVMASYYEIDSVIIAVGTTCVACLALSFFAMQTRWDFTPMIGAFLMMSIILIIFGVVLIFVRIPLLHLIYSCLGAILFSLYLIFDTQMIMGGNHRYAISPDEVVFAALTLYTDVMLMFTYILRIIGLSKNM